MKRKLHTLFSVLPILFASLFLLIGCATSKVNWDSRVGNYTYDQAVVELGPPERSAKLSDGRTVSEWLLFRGRSGGHYHHAPAFYPPYYGSSWNYNEPSFPDRFVRLTFSPDGRLESWKKIAK